MKMEEGMPLIDGNGKFNVEGLKDFMTTTEFAQRDLSYAIVAIIGPQSSGLLWLLSAACIKVGRPQIAKRAIELVEQRAYPKMGDLSIMMVRLANMLGSQQGNIRLFCGDTFYDRLQQSYEI